MTAPRAIIIDRDLYSGVLSALGRRGARRRESGAFLLADATAAAHETDGEVRVVATAYYDDLDPTCLTGGITFTAAGYTALNAVCRHRGLRVVADIHTHPHDWVHQSPIDAAHPMVALPGHFAIIAPNFATGNLEPERLGVHVLGADQSWTSYFGANVASVMRVAEPQRLGWLGSILHKVKELTRPATGRRS